MKKISLFFTPEIQKLMDSDEVGHLWHDAANRMARLSQTARELSYSGYGVHSGWQTRHARVQRAMEITGGSHGSAWRYFCPGEDKCHELREAVRRAHRFENTVARYNSDVTLEMRFYEKNARKPFLSLNFTLGSNEACGEGPIYLSNEIVRSL